MTVPFALLLFATAVTIVAPRVLTRAGWATRAPRWGILAWQASVVSVLSALVLLALAAFWPVERVWFDLGHLLHACPEVLRRRYDLLHPSGVRVAGLLVAGLVALSLMRALALSVLTVRRTRARHRELLALLGDDCEGLHGAQVLEHDVPLAYCIPGAGGRVVLTSATLTTLTGDQLAAVLAHERAHLHGRHDLVLLGADVAASALPWPGFFRVARDELRKLVEMLADDRALRTSSRRSLAAALVGLGSATAPAGALGASGHAIARVERLLAEPTTMLSVLRRTYVLTVTSVLVAAPWLIVALPALAARRTPHCPT